MCVESASGCFGLAVCALKSHAKLIEDAMIDRTVFNELRLQKPQRYSSQSQTDHHIIVQRLTVGVQGGERQPARCNRTCPKLVRER